MNKLALILGCMFFTFSAFSQKDSLTIFQYHPDKEAKEAVSKIMKYTGLEPNFQIVIEDVKTVIAYIKGGKRYVAYNPEFIKRVRFESNTDWAAVSVLAHEIGHHLLGHTLKYRPTNPGNELAAEKFSGFILFNMGATLEEAVAAIESIGHELDTTYHPSQSARIEAIKNGWLQAKEIDNEVAYVKVNPDDKRRLSFVFKCTFKTDDNIYFVDELNRIIWFDNYGTAVVIGEMRESDSSDYKWVYQVDENKYYIDSKGEIWDVTSYGTVLKIGKAEIISSE